MVWLTRLEARTCAVLWRLLEEAFVSRMGGRRGGRRDGRRPFLVVFIGM